MRAPSASSTSAEPEGLVAERLPCLATAQPAPAAISAAVVETLKVRRPPPVPAVSSRSVRAVGTCGGELAHGAREPGELLGGLALGAQGDEEGGDLRLGDLAVHDLIEHLGGLLGAEVAPRGERVDGFGEDFVGHWVLAENIWQVALQSIAPGNGSPLAGDGPRRQARKLASSALALDR